jgi:hypothetical protein
MTSLVFDANMEYERWRALQGSPGSEKEQFAFTEGYIAGCYQQKPLKMNVAVLKMKLAMLQGRVFRFLKYGSGEQYELERKNLVQAYEESFEDIS